MGKFSEAPGPEPILHPHKLGCRLSRLLRTLDGEDRAVVESYLAQHETYSDRTMMQWFSARGHKDISTEIIRSHRSGNCCHAEGKVR